MGAEGLKTGNFTLMPLLKTFGATTPATTCWIAGLRQLIACLILWHFPHCHLWCLPWPRAARAALKLRAKCSKTQSSFAAHARQPNWVHPSFVPLTFLAPCAVHNLLIATNSTSIQFKCIFVFNSIATWRFLRRALPRPATPTCRPPTTPLWVVAINWITCFQLPLLCAHRYTL